MCVEKKNRERYKLSQQTEKWSEFVCLLIFNRHFNGILHTNLRIIFNSVGESCQSSLKINNPSNVTMKTSAIYLQWNQSLIIDTGSYIQNTEPRVQPEEAGKLNMIWDRNKNPKSQIDIRRIIRLCWSIFKRWSINQ